jgi:signal transduction histidine kinase
MAVARHRCAAGWRHSVVPAIGVWKTPTLLGSIGAGARQMLEAAKGWARDAIGEVRRVVYGLRPAVLDQLGLVRAVEVAEREFQAGRVRKHLTERIDTLHL